MLRRLVGGFRAHDAHLLLEDLAVVAATLLGTPSCLSTARALVFGVLLLLVRCAAAYGDQLQSLMQLFSIATGTREHPGAVRM